MNEKLKELAEQVEKRFGFVWTDRFHNGQVQIDALVELVRQDEREACAALCDELSNEVSNKNFIAVDQRQFCAKQIRARGKK